MIDNLKDLEKLFKLCRREGVFDLDIGTVKFKMAEYIPGTSTTTEEKTKYEGFPEGELTPEQLMFYSAGGLPENDPFLKDKSA